MRIHELVTAMLLGLSAHAQALDYPPAPRVPVTDRYHGVDVVDDYRWLEPADAPAVQEWVAAQNGHTRRILDALPGRGALHARIDELRKSTSNTYYDIVERGGSLFAMKQQPPKQQPLLVALKSPDSTADERVVLDPNVLSDSGAVSIDFYVPSWDGRKVAVAISAHGSEDATLHVYDVRSGRELGDTIPRVNYPTAGGSVAWSRDGSGFFYTRYPAPGERGAADLPFYQQVWYHRLGTATTQDRYEIGRAFPRIAEIQLASSRDGRWVTALVANGDGGEHELYLRERRGWRKVAGYAAEVKAAQFGDDGWLYLLSRRDAPRGRILRLPLARPDMARARTVLAEGEGSLNEFVVDGPRLIVEDLLGGPSRLRSVDLHSGRVETIALPPVSGVGALVRAGPGQILAMVASYLAPPAWYRVDAGGVPRKTALAQTTIADMSDCEVRRELAPSPDGTLVPLTILQRKGTPRDGHNATLLSGYGGYGISLTPHFRALHRVWLDHGGVVVVANLRGGGEWGEAWHVAGKGTRKQAVFDDFIAVAEHLVRERVTAPSRLAIEGGSNGGLLMGAAFTQRPDLFRAVVSWVGIYDMLRVELDPNGEFNVTEFGTVRDKAQFDAMYAYSPFHRVHDGIDYPAVLFITGDNDGRVNPAQSRKMAARLQAANRNGRPILLRTSSDSGHGMGTALDARIEMETDAYAFLLHELAP